MMISTTILKFLLFYFQYLCIYEYSSHIIHRPTGLLPSICLLLYHILIFSVCYEFQGFLHFNFSYICTMYAFSSPVCTNSVLNNTAIFMPYALQISGTLAHRYNLCLPVCTHCFAPYVKFSFKQSHSTHAPRHFILSTGFILLL